MMDKSTLLPYILYQSKALRFAKLHPQEGAIGLGVKDWIRLVSITPGNKFLFLNDTTKVHLRQRSICFAKHRAITRAEAIITLFYDTKKIHQP